MQGRRYRRVIREDVKKVHDHLFSRGVQTALWGDMLLESVRGRGLQKHTTRDGWVYYMPGGMTPEQVQRLIPKDCLIFNWFWSNEPGERGGNAELNEAILDKMGFRQIYGNFEPTIENYNSRKKRATLLGGAPSAWFATNEVGFGKNLMSTFLGCSSILWTGQVIDGKDLSGRVQSMLPTIRTRLSGITPPTQTETSIVPVDISSEFNSGNNVSGLRSSWDGDRNDPFEQHSVRFEICRMVWIPLLSEQMERAARTYRRAVTGILIGEAPTSLIFLHAAAKPASNKESFRVIWDQEDTADLLAWYEVVYEDGFVSTIPIRYGVNILEWSWDQRVSYNAYCYGADAVAVGAEPNNRITFFALEWINPRLGKVIRQIHLKGTTGFRGGSDHYDNEWGTVIESNAVILKAISMVQKRT